MAAGNPFWDIHNAIWGMLENDDVSDDLTALDKHFTDLVKSRNRIKFIGTAHDLWKRKLAAGDLPEVAIVQTGLAFKDRFDSNDDQIILNWSIWVATGEQPAGKMWDVQWAIFRQLQHWQTALADTLTWKSEYYVKDCNILQTEDALDHEFLNRLTKGWSSMWTLETACHFSHSKVIV